MPFDGVKGLGLDLDADQIDLGMFSAPPAPASGVETISEGISVTSRKIASPSRRGRPASTSALSPADRQQRHREKKTQSVALAAKALFKAKDDGDWEAVERIARALMQV